MSPPPWPTSRCRWTCWSASCWMSISSCRGIRASNWPPAVCGLRTDRSPLAANAECRALALLALAEVGQRAGDTVGIPVRVAHGGAAREDPDVGAVRALDAVLVDEVLRPPAEID